ncbi:ABC transporter permease subunit [soil metagenome]
MIALFRLLALGLFILLWWVASLLITRNLVPTPWATALAAVDLLRDGGLVRATGETLGVYLSGYSIAAVVAIPFGVVIGSFRTLGRTLDPYINAFTATPRVAFVPLIIGLLGLGFNAKIAIVFLGAVMPIVINTYAGVVNADGELIEMARSAGANRAQTFRRIVLPGSMPFIVAGLRLGATIGLINTVVAELYTAVRGLGGLLAVYGNTFRMPQYFVVVLTLALIGGVVSQSLRFLESWMERWRYDGGEK